MLSSKNRIYGLSIGGAIADSMGAVISFKPTYHMDSPYDSLAVNIQPGYWTEPTGLWYGRLCDPDSLSLTHKTCTGVIQNCTKYPILTKLVQSSVYSLIYHNDYKVQLDAVKTYLDTGSVVGNHMVRFWISLIDGVLHQASKRALFSQEMYSHLDLVPEVYYVLCLQPNEHLNGELEIVREVLEVFKTTDNFVQGVHVIVNQSVNPCWAGALYGQLAGAYYGLTDIPEDWMDIVQDSEGIIKRCSLLIWGT